MDKFSIYRILRKGSLPVLALLTACTDNYQNPFTADAERIRPTVENVRLVLTDRDADADTRLNYGSDGYRFEAGDTLAACLMDFPDETAMADPYASWYDKYKLIGNINTNYPFVRDARGTWSSSAKLSEGNYFFMFPYNSRNGSRQAYTHTLGTQTMEDGSMASLMRLYAESNFFVGYSAIKEGTSNSDAVRIDMCPVFGALGIVLRNDGKRSYTVKRILLRHLDGGFPTTVAVNPTACTYATDNGLFNIAQYIGDDSDAGRANGYEEDRVDYHRMKALEDLVKPLPGQTAEKLEVRITDGAEVLPGQEQRLLVMLPKGEYEDLLLEVETDRGIVHNLLLEGATSVATDRKTLRTVSFKDEDVSRLPAVNASATEDLARLIHWNVNTPTILTANLQTDVSVTAAMYEELRDGKSDSLLINLNGHNLLLEDDVDETALCGKLAFSEGDPKGGRVIVTGRQLLSKGIGVTLQNEGELRILNGKGFQIENRGVLTVNGETASAEIITSGAMLVEEGASIDGLVTIEEGGVAVNRGMLSKVVNAGRLTNLGKVSDGSNTGLLMNLAGEVRLEENIGRVHAEGCSSTLIGDNEADAEKGTLIITRLATDGNIKVENTNRKGYVVQEMEGEQNTDTINPLANTIWLNGWLAGSKDKTGYAQPIDLSGYAVVATGAEARLSNEGAELKIGALQVNAGASLTIYRTDVQCPIVSMAGNSEAPACLTISSLSNLYSEQKAMQIVMHNGTAYNIVKNYGSEKTKIEINGEKSGRFDRRKNSLIVF